MNEYFVHIEIMGHDSLMKACDLLHDARCDISILEVDRNIGSLRAFFEREFFEDLSLLHSEPRLFIFTKHTFPFISSQLTLQDVVSYEIEDESQIGTYTFNECRLNDDAYELYFCEKLKIILRFKDKPRGELCDLNLSAKKGSFYTIKNPFRKKTCQGGDLA
jgi:hypothetical protein